MEAQALINLYPGDLILEDTLATFEVERIHADPSVGELGGYSASFVGLPFGNITLDRNTIQLAIGVEALRDIEKDVSERVSDDPEAFILGWAA